MNLSELKQRRIDLCLEAASSEKWFEALKHARRAKELEIAEHISKEIRQK